MRRREGSRSAALLLLVAAGIAAGGMWLVLVSIRHTGASVTSVDDTVPSEADQAPADLGDSSSASEGMSVGPDEEAAGSMEGMSARMPNAVGRDGGRRESQGALANLSPGVGDVSRRSSPLPLIDEATEVLRAYRVQGSCVLAQSGFLDFFGRVWSCTVVGDGWVEVQVLTERGEGTDVELVRMDAAQWEGGLADMDAAPREEGA